MDDLIVIILTLIIAAVGALGQLKKKKRAAPVDRSVKNEPESLWDLIQGESNIAGQTEVEDFVEREVVVKEEPDEYQYVVSTEDANYEFKAENEGQSILKDIKPGESKKTKMKSRLKEDFSLRKAVIYSEILNRKYT